MKIISDCQAQQIVRHAIQKEIEAKFAERVKTATPSERVNLKAQIAEEVEIKIKQHRSRGYAKPIPIPLIH